MGYLGFITLMGLLSGVIGTAGGGLAVLFIRTIRDRLLGVVLGISAGIMAAVVFLDLVPEAIEEGTLGTALLGLLLGVGIIAFLDLKYPHQHFSFFTEARQGMNEDQSRYLKVGILLCIGIALHNIPEGLAIGAGFISSYEMGMGLAILMAIQNFPEGMAVATALGLSGMRAGGMLFITALAGVPMGVGAFIGGFLGGISEFFLSISLAFAAGAMLYIVFDELIPDAHRKAEGHWAIAGILTGIIVGIVLIDLLH